MKEIDWDFPVNGFDFDNAKKIAVNHAIEEVISRVIPSRLRKEYKKLDDLICNYMYICGSLSSLNWDINRETEPFAELDKSIEDLSRLEEDIIQRLNELVATLSTNHAPDNFKMIAELSTQGLKISKSRESRQHLVDSGRKDVTQKSVNARDAQTEIKLLVAQIQSQLLTIEGLNNKGIKRLDNLELTERQLEVVYHLNISATEKVNLVRCIRSRISMLIAIYKEVEEIAKEMLNNYKDRRLFLDMPIPLIDRARLVYSASLITSDFEFGIASLSEDEIQAMDYITNFLNDTFDTDPKIIQDFSYNGHIRANFRRAMVDLRIALDNKKYIQNNR
ncbi:MAG: hypothetical protein E7163_04085 [Firmicutes bacterium]|nr:hypothetical protein [Bacillota bacterium]